MPKLAEKLKPTLNCTLLNIGNTLEAKQTRMDEGLLMSESLLKKIRSSDVPVRSWPCRLREVCLLAVLEINAEFKWGDRFNKSTFIPFKVDFFEDTKPTELFLCYTSMTGFAIVLPQDIRRKS